MHSIKEQALENFSTQLLIKTREYVAGFIGENFTEKICYHDINHTLEVVEASEIIGKSCRISDEELETVIIAAWFHDIGYYLGCDNHEAASAKIALQFLNEEHIDTRRINTVVNCILATKVPQLPTNLLEKIICDADLFHLGTEKFFEKSVLLWRELTLHNQEMTLEGWFKQSRKFVEAHKYHTNYGKEILQPNQKNNLSLLNAKIEGYGQ